MKSPNRRAVSKWWTVLAIAILMLSHLSCKEKIEGCMDVTAVNWNAAADKACDDCCNYPSLAVSMSHLYGDTLVFFDSTYLDDFENPFLIAGLRYYLSDFNVYSGGVEYGPSDSLEVELIIGSTNEEARIVDNFVLASKFKTSSSIGTFQNTDIVIDTVQFSLGLNEVANSVDPVSISAGHPLAIDSDSMFQSIDEGYIFAKISIVPDTMTMDTVIYRIIGNENLMKMRLEWDGQLIRGTDVTIPIKIDYQEWFKGINFVDDPEDSVKIKFVNNLAKAFFIEE